MREIQQKERECDRGNVSVRIGEVILRRWHMSGALGEVKE